MKKTVGLEKNSNSKVLSPNGFVIDEIILITHDNLEIDISRIVADLQLTQSIYNLCVNLELAIVDNNNYFSSLQLMGQEKIKITISREQNLDDSIKNKKNQKITKEFFIYEYKNIYKTSETSVTFNVTASSVFFQKNLTKYISKKFNDTIENSIKNILIEDLGIFEKNIISSKNIDKKMSILIPNLRPFEAITLLGRKFLDHENSPIFIYETLENKIYLKSYSDILNISEENIDYYKHSTLPSTNVETFSKEEYLKIKSHIKDFYSERGFSKYKRLNEGGYCNSTETFDISTGEYKKSTFSFDDLNLKLIDKNKPFSIVDNINEITLDKNFDSRKDYYVVNKNLSEDNFSLISAVNSKYKNAYISNMENMYFSMEIFGDLELYPGKLVNIEIRSYQDNETFTKETRKDDYLSGKYLIVSVVHTFNTEFSTKVIVKRDSFQKEFSKESVKKNANL